MIDVEYPILFVGLLISLVTYFVMLSIGVMKRIWTPMGLFIASLLSFIPAMIGALVQALIYHEFLLIVPVEFIIAIIAIMVGVSNYGHSKKEPWKTRLRIKNDDN